MEVGGETERHGENKENKQRWYPWINVQTSKQCCSWWLANPSHYRRQETNRNALCYKCCNLVLIRLNDGGLSGGGLRVRTLQTYRMDKSPNILSESQVQRLRSAVYVQQKHFNWEWVYSAGPQRVGLHVCAQICHPANQLLGGCTPEATLHTGCRYTGELMCASPPQHSGGKSGEARSGRWWSAVFA